MHTEPNSEAVIISQHAQYKQKDETQSAVESEVQLQPEFRLRRRVFFFYKLQPSCGKNLPPERCNYSNKINRVKKCCQHSSQQAKCPWARNWAWSDLYWSAPTVRSILCNHMFLFCSALVAQLWTENILRCLEHGVNHLMKYSQWKHNWMANLLQIQIE